VGEVYNIGTQKERTVLDVAHDIAKVFGLPESQVVHVRDRAFNDRRYYICDSKLNSLGWREGTSWEDGLRKTVDWFLKATPKYWDNGNVEQALEAHPTLQVTSSTPATVF
jgi:UDP-glucose 4,6-dehydratase